MPRGGGGGGASGLPGAGASSLATAAGEGRGWSPLRAAAMAAGSPPPLEPSPLPVFSDEGFGDKFLRKTRENPLVPLGEGGGRGVTGGGREGGGPGPWRLVRREGRELRVGPS